MDAREVVGRRLAANGLAGPGRPAPEDVVRHLLAVQSQDVQPSAWSVAQRGPAHERVVEAARADGRVLRTHVLRPTWHDVAAPDVRWLLRLTGPRVQQATAGRRRDLGVDDDVLRRARTALERTLPGRHLHRAEVKAVLAEAGLPLEGQALPHCLLHLELDGLLCSGVRDGARQTWALLDERVPAAPPLAQDEAVAELVLRFLLGHGPATVQDLAWWSSLRVRDLRTALADLGDSVWCDDVDGLSLWAARDAPPAASAGVRLVQLYDEHLVAFTQSKPLSDPSRFAAVRDRPFSGVVLDDGFVAGSWGRTVGRSGVVVEVAPLRPLDVDGLQAEVAAYGRFLEVDAELVVRG